MEMRKKILAAESAEEIAEILKEYGRDPGDAEKIFREVSANKLEEVSLDEMEAVAGGADRDFAREGCASTVEPGSWCGSNDECVIFSVTYDHPPKFICKRCGGGMYFLRSKGNHDIYVCALCLAEEKFKTVDMPLDY